MGAEKKKRDLSLEIMRLVAMFFVIFNHTGLKGYFLFADCKQGSPAFWIYMAMSVLDKFAVPLYFMISGALLLGKDEDLGTLFRKRISKTALSLLVISAVYYLIDMTNGTIRYKGVENILDFFVRLCCGNVKFHLWFLYSYLIFLLILPFLRKIVKGLNNKEFIYMFILCLSIMVLKPVFEYTFFSGKHLHYTLDLLETNNIVFPILGYYLYHKVDISAMKKRWLAAAWGINLVLTVVACILTYIRIKQTGKVDEDHSQQFHRMFAMINAVTVFITIKRLTPDVKNKVVSWFICTAGGCTFGIYLFHPMLMKDTQMVELWDTLSKVIPNQMIATLIFCLVIFLVAMIFTFLLKLIPFVKKLL